MPRRLLRDGAIAVDQWRTLDEVRAAENGAAASAGVSAAEAFPEYEVIWFAPPCPEPHPTSAMADPSIATIPRLNW